ncbi:MAG: hypothetical protein ACFFD4_17500 [Candidatus Odinarchaeota archaeon]
MTGLATKEGTPMQRRLVISTMVLIIGLMVSAIFIMGTLFLSDGSGNTQEPVNSGDDSIIWVIVMVFGGFISVVAGFLTFIIRRYYR